MDEERAEIAAVIKDYLDGTVFADEAKLRRAMHPRWHCVGHFSGGLEWSSLEEYIAFCRKARPAAPDPDYFWEIAALEVVGDTAQARVLDDYLGIRFTDLLTLLKHEGRWQIVGKVFYAHPKKAAA